MKHATVLGHSPLPVALPIEVDTDHDDHLNLHELVELVKKVMVAQNKPWINKYEVGSQVLVHAKPACLRCLSFPMRAVFVQLYSPFLEATLARLTLNLSWRPPWPARPKKRCTNSMPTGMDCSPSPNFAS